MKPDKLGKILRIAAVILLSLTAAMNVLGGAGTSCAAFFTKQYPPMWALLDYQTLYQFFVVASILVGIAGVWAAVGLVRGGKNAYRNTLWVLGIGTLLAGVHFGSSLVLRGKATPADVKFYTNAFTLIYTLFLRLPGIWERVDFSGDGGGMDKRMSAGMAAVVCGAALLTTASWAGPSHTYQGENWVLMLQWPLFFGGLALILIGMGKVLGIVMQLLRDEPRAELLEKPGESS